MTRTIQAEQPQPAVTLEAFEARIPYVQQPLITFLLPLLSNREEAEEAAQDTLLKAYRALREGTIVAQPAFLSWLYRIARNTAIDILRRRRLIRWIPLSTFDDHAKTDEGASHQQTHRTSGICSLEDTRGNFEESVANLTLLQEILSLIPQQDATCLRAYIYGYSYAEIAAFLGINRDAVKMRILRDRRRCAAAYQKEAQA
jgi:RNA polymerase sigma factor (sigma-70 family)